MSESEAASLSIRTFCYPQDFNEVYTLWQTAGPGIHVGRSDEAEQIGKKIQSDADLFLVAEAGGKLIGAVLGGFDGRRGMVYHLAVKVDHRRKGVGDALMDELERRLRVKGCLRSYLLVTYDNEEAIRFYERRGWERMELFAYGKDLD